MTKQMMLVSLEEVSTAVNAPTDFVRAWVSKLRVELLRDWANREAVAPEDATRLLAAIRESGKAAAELNRDFELYETDWRRRQHAAGEAAFQDYIAQSLEQQRRSAPSADFAFYGSNFLATPTSSGTYLAANQAAELARQAFEKHEPKLDFDSFERKWKKGRK